MLKGNRLRAALTIAAWLIALLIGLWTAPDVYASGCEGWRKLAPEAKVFERICIYTAD